MAVMRLKPADLITKIVLILLLVFAVGSMITIRARTEDLRREIAVLQDKAADLEVRNAELEYYVEHENDDDVIAAIARKYWGFVRPDEKVYYDSND